MLQLIDQMLEQSLTKWKSITRSTTVDQLKALHEYTEDDDGNVTRPLAEFPEEI